MKYPFPGVVVMSQSIHSICVFCGSADGLLPQYDAAAHAMGAALAEAGITLVYGAGRTGMMGALAEGALAAGGTVIGIVPLGLESPALIYTTGLTRLEVVDNIQVRKWRMGELADAFIALPGGFGTLDELFEALTWTQIGVHRKPVGLLNTTGYFDLLLAWMKRAEQDHFIFPEHRQLFTVSEQPKELLAQLNNFQLPEGLERWVNREID